jgi:predicted nucleic acid-binding protein
MDQPMSCTLNSDRECLKVVDTFRVADLREIHFLWRPILKDPQDDHVLEVAVESSAKFIVTYNRRDFMGAEKFGIKVVTPNEFLEKIGEGL